MYNLRDAYRYDILIETPDPSGSTVHTDEEDADSSIDEELELPEICDFLRFYF